jgi:hypothetical protein
MDNIEVICIKSTEKLLKGAKYEIFKIEKSYHQRRYYVDGGKAASYININYFKTVDPKINLDAVEIFDNSIGSISDTSWKNSISQMKFEGTTETIKKEMIGNIVQCGGNSSSKYLLKKNFYTIVDIKLIENSWDKCIRIDQIKVNNGKGSWYTARNFFQVNKKIQRKLKMNKLATGSDITTIKRKFLAYSDNQRLSIVLLICSKILNDAEYTSDTSNIKLEELIIEKANKHDMVKEDLKDFKQIINATKKLI